MNLFDALVCEFDLTSVEAARIRNIVAGIGLHLEDAAVVESIRSTLRHHGIGAFDPNFRMSLWALEIVYNDDELAPDVGHATESIQRMFHVENVSWKHGPQMPTLEVSFGFTCPEGWFAPLTEALGKAIRTRIKEFVVAANRRGAGGNSRR